ncbi:Ribonuclease 3 [Streptomyces aurantiogriseus]
MSDAKADSVARKKADNTASSHTLLEGRLGYHVESALLVRALTHRSYAYENGGLPTNERLEFLGDSVLGLVVTDTLYRTHPDLPEGQLAKLRAAVGSACCVALVAGEGRGRLDLGSCHPAVADRVLRGRRAPRWSEGSCSVLATRWPVGVIDAVCRLGPRGLARPRALRPCSPTRCSTRALGRAAPRFPVRPRPIWHESGTAR